MIKLFTVKSGLITIFAGLIMSMPSFAHAQTIIPVPLKMEQKSGNFLFSKDTKLYSNLKGEELKLMTDYLATLPLQLKKGKKAEAPQTVSLLLTKETSQSTSTEGYTLSVTPNQIIIKSASGAGLFYGLQSMLQLSTTVGSSLSVPAVEITDTPRFAYRGLMLDVSRHFLSKEFVKKQIDALAYYKLNRLHLHLTDGAGWRIEIKKYPLLTEFAAWRPEANWKKWWNGGRQYCRFDEPGASGGFYTQDDIRELVAYARQHHMTIIPEIEMPSHSEEVLATYPELSCTGEPYKNADFCVGNEATFTFLENVLTEVMQLFPSEYIHIGGDEAGKAAWKTCPKCQKRMQEEKISDVDGLQSYLIHRIEVFLNKHGRKLLGWDEILQGGLAPNATVMSWRGEEGGIAAIRSGHQAIMTPGGYCYFDTYQDAPDSQPEAIGGYLPLKKVYSYNPVPEVLSAEEAKLVYGVQGNVWAEYIPTPEHREYMIYPRILALAEVAWSAPERKLWTDFHNRTLKALSYLQSKGYHTFDLSKEIGSRPEAAETTRHLAFGKKVVYNAPYNASYPAKGDVTLTDGVRGDWTYGDGAWQGFISAGRLDVTIDLEKETEIHSVTADFMQGVGAEVYLPAEVIISISTDGTNYTELKNEKYPLDLNQAIKFTKLGWEGTAVARYIRYQARATKEHGGWVFTDEIVVR